jgi:hypothetical protein
MELDGDVYLFDFIKWEPIECKRCHEKNERL